MLQPAPPELLLGSKRYEIVAPNEVVFDHLIATGKFDEAQRFIDIYLGHLSNAMKDSGYDSHFFHAALKELALPLYHKCYADTTGEPYHDARDNLSHVYDQSRDLMRLLDTYRHMPDTPNNRPLGDMSELAVFALMTKGLSGYGDDYTVMPSFATEDAAARTTDHFYRGYDLLVHDRNNDQFVALQVKTSSRRYKHYVNDVTVVSFSQLADLARVPRDDLFELIINDAGHDDGTVDLAAGILKNFIGEVSAAQAA